MALTESRGAPKKRIAFSPAALYDEFAEKAVLGCMLSQPDEVIHEIKLTKQDFFVPAHKEIFECLTTLHEENSGVDVISAHRWLEDRKLAKAVGSPGILAELLSGFATHLNVGTYARAVAEKSALRVLQEAAATIAADIAEMPDSIASIFDRAETAISDATMFAKIGTEEKWCDIADRTSREAIEFSEMGGGLRGHPTGFQKLDEILSGWQPGKLVVVGASMGVGKTALTVTFLRHLLRRGVPCGMFSMEMDADEIGNRFLSSEAVIGGRVILNGSLTQEQQRVIRSTGDKIREWPFFLDCSSGLDIQQIRSRARRWKRRHLIEAIGIDFAQIARSRRFQDNKVLEVADIARNSKEMAMELECTVFLLSQLNCDSNEVPTKTSLKDSKAIAEAADIILLVHEESRECDGDIRRYVLHVAKQRAGVDGRRFFVSYQAWRTHFEQSREQ